mmetsp:Transcript_21791/g.52702  ORF Transcript_21791/g.52702 Transcript_21791/m.52702 type:complete len:233 (+) Transcript_21791:1108-1806(+)
MCRMAGGGGGGGGRDGGSRRLWRGTNNGVSRRLRLGRGGGRLGGIGPARVSDDGIDHGHVVEEGQAALVGGLLHLLGATLVSTTRCRCEAGCAVHAGGGHSRGHRGRRLAHRAHHRRGGGDGLDAAPPGGRAEGHDLHQPPVLVAVVERAARAPPADADADRRVDRRRAGRRHRGRGVPHRQAQAHLQHPLGVLNPIVVLLAHAPHDRVLRAGLAADLRDGIAAHPPPSAVA